MQTRSQTRKKHSVVEHIIDFDEASKAWKTNKKCIGNGHYKYICIIVKEDSKLCGKSCYNNSSFCWIHRNKTN